MSDRGEKIVQLAQEMIQSGAMQNTPNRPSPAMKEKSLALKAACLAALISATGGAAVAHLADEAHRPINRYERTEIDALVFYAARRAGTNETALRDQIQRALTLPSLSDLSVFDYRRVRDYLWTHIEE